MNHTLNINTILHTKDGRKIGNAIVTGIEGYFWTIKTDYDTETRMTSEEIYDCFYIAWDNFTEENNGYTCEQMQKRMQEYHKHRVNI